MNMNGFIEVTDCRGKFLLNTATFENVRGNEIVLSNGSTYEVKETYSELKALIDAKDLFEEW